MSDGVASVLAGAAPHPAAASAALRAEPNEVTIWCQREAASGASGATTGVCADVHRVGTPQVPCIETCGGPNVSCYASTCYNKDPVKTNCASYASTNQDVYGGGLGEYGGTPEYVDNRWSSACQANWSRTWSNGPWIYDINSTVAYDAEYEWAPCWCYSTGFDQLSFSGWYQTVWTNMLDGGAGTPCTGSYTWDYFYYYTDCF